MRKEILNIISNVKDKKIELINLGITDDELPEILKYISKHQPKISCLCLNNNQLTDKSAEKLVQLLSEVKGLVLLDLQSNHFTNQALPTLYQLKGSLPQLKFGLAGNHHLNAGLVDALTKSYRQAGL